MPKAVKVTESQSVILTNLFEPVVWSAVAHRFAIPLCKQPVSIHPLVTEALAFLLLLCFEFSE